MAPGQQRALRLAVIGLGQRMAHVVRAMADVNWPVEVVGYADPNPAGLPLLRGFGFDGGVAFSDAAALLKAGRFDLVMIGSPNHLHLDHLKAAMSCGAPVFVEKPIVRTEAESYELARLLAEHRGADIYVGLVLRSMPLVRDVLARVDRGEIGRLISIDATEHLPPEHGGYLARNWRRKQAWGGSFLLDKVCHDFDLFARLAGARASRVASFGGRRIFHDAATISGHDAYSRIDAGWEGAQDAFRSGMDVADHQVALVEYANDVRLSFHCNSHVSLTERRWFLAGDEGTLIADLVRNRMMIRRAHERGKPERVDFHVRASDSHNGADQAMAADLRAAIEGRAPFPVTPRESLEAGLTVMAIDQAMERRAVVECAPMWAQLDAAFGHVR